MSSPDLCYPIGRFAPPAATDAAARAGFVAQLAVAPDLLRRAVAGMGDERLDTPYRPGGWTVRQVVHHLPDSHLNAYVRFKLALTESEPVIRTYDEKLWAGLPEARTGPAELSLDLLDALHRRWVAALRALAPDAFARTLRHPDLGPMTVDRLVALYAWHGRHPVAHVTALAAREGWR
jgi:hypothetical protein